MSKCNAKRNAKRKPIMYIVHHAPDRSESDSLLGYTVSSTVRTYTDAEWEAWLDAAYERNQEAHSNTCWNGDNHGDK